MAKRHLWKVIKFRAQHQSVVLTTHSMEEADACCDRITIQVNGQLRCLGTPLHLKNAYGSGYQIEFNLKSSGEANMDPQEQQSRLQDFVTNQLASKRALEKNYGTHFVCRLGESEKDISLGDIFTKTQTARDELEINDYTISQPTLEQVFLKFAQEQIDTEATLGGGGVVI